MALYKRSQIDLVVSNALRAAEARIAGKTLMFLGVGEARQVITLIEKGYCNRFVRQCFETALGMTPFSWYFGAAKAKDTLAKLAPYEVAKPEAGDIVGWSGDPGHIAIVLGDVYGDGRFLVAENTSSSSRGEPRAAGTKLTRLSSIRAAGRKFFRLWA